MNKIRLISIVAIVSTAYIIISERFGVEGYITACNSKDNEPSQVVADCTALLERDDVSDKIRANALFRRAYRVEPNNPSQAEVDYLAVLEIRPDWKAPLNNLGVIYLNNDNPGTALQYLNKGLDVKPDALDLRENRAEAYFELERYDEALADTEIALKSDPDNLRVQLFRGRSLEKLGEYDLALEAFSGIIIDDGDNTRARRERAWLYYRHLELPYHAEVDLRHVLTRDPKNRRALALLGYVMLRLDGYPEAIDAFEQALAIKSDYGYATRGLGRAVGELEEQRQRNARLSTPEGRELAGHAFGTLLASNYSDVGDLTRALTEYDAVLSRLPNNIFAHAGKANVYYSLGNDRAAINAIDNFFAVVDTQLDEPKASSKLIAAMHTRRGNSLHRLSDAAAAFAAWQSGLANARKSDISLWQLRLQSAGHYSDWPNGKISSELIEGLAACAEDMTCLD